MSLPRIRQRHPVLLWRANGAGTAAGSPGRTQVQAAGVPAVTVSVSVYDAPISFHNRIFLAYPTLGSDLTSTRRTSCQTLARDHALPPDHLQGQIAAYASAKLLVEGLDGPAGA